MKSLSNFAFSLIAVLLIVAISLTTSFAKGSTKYDPVKGYTLNKTVLKVSGYLAIKQFTFADVGTLPNKIVIDYYSYRPNVKPVNDPKPDNINFQLIRVKQINLKHPECTC